MWLEDLLLGGANSLLSGGINYAFQQMVAQQNYQLAEQSAENQYQRQLDFWNKQNAYNTPTQQVNRRLAAGLAPTDGVDSGNASSLLSVPGNNVGLNGALQFESNIDLLQSMRTISDIRKLAKDGDYIDQQISNLIIEGVLLGMEKDLKDAGLKEMAERLKSIIEDNRSKRLDNDRKERENKNLFTDRYYQLLGQQLENNVWMQGQDIDIKGAEQAIAEFTRNLYTKYGITPEILNQLISAGSHLVGDITSLGKDFVLGKLFGKKGKK